MGGYYIKGGIYRLVEALEAVARERGVQIRTSAEVERICRVGKRVNGVQVNGELVDADYVLCGADAVVAYHELIDGTSAPTQEGESIGTVAIGDGIPLGD